MVSDLLKATQGVCPLLLKSLIQISIQSISGIKACLAQDFGGPILDYSTASSLTSLPPASPFWSIFYTAPRMALLRSSLLSHTIPDVSFIPATQASPGPKRHALSRVTLLLCSHCPEASSLPCQL